LQKELQKLDSEHYEKIDKQNPHRLIRAIEILRQSDGKKIAELLQNKTTRNFKTIYIGLNTERSLLYERINKRVDIMIEKGLLEEVRKLYPHRHLNALQTVGYRELFSYFDGDTDLDFAISEIKKNTRRFAKRQLTWFRKNKDIQWFDIDYDMGEIILFLQEMQIISL